MARSRYPSYTCEAQVIRLERELDEARSAIIDLMPEHFQSILHSYYPCESRQQLYAWERDVTEKIIGLATILSPEEGSYFSDRAYCPLCRDGSSSPHEKGFSVPEGLRRHLEGWGDHVRRCCVMVAAMRLARDYFHEKFHDAEEKERMESLRLAQQRKETELLYLIDPTQDPCLLDESLGFGATPRDAMGMAWAEQRLVELGFVSATENKIKQYTLDSGDVLVFADPRANGQIFFRVFNKPIPKHARRRTLRVPLFRSFFLKDNWKNDIRSKFEARLADATG